MPPRFQSRSPPVMVVDHCASSTLLLAWSSILVLPFVAFNLIIMRRHQDMFTSVASNQKYAYVNRKNNQALLLPLQACACDATGDTYPRRGKAPGNVACCKPTVFR